MLWKRFLYDTVITYTHNVTYLVKQRYDTEKRIQILVAIAKMFPMVSNLFIHFLHPSLDDHCMSSTSPSINFHDFFLSRKCRDRSGNDFSVIEWSMSNLTAKLGFLTIWVFTIPFSFSGVIFRPTSPTLKEVTLIIFNDYFHF